MEERLFLNGVLVPALCAVAVALVLRRHHVRWLGASVLLPLAMSAASQQGSWAWPRAGEWTWMVVAMALVAACGAAGGRDAGSRTGRGVVCAMAACMTSLLLPLPGWNDAMSRMALAVGAALASAWLLPLGMHRGGLSTWLGWSMAIVAPSAVALSCGFAKLAVALGSVSATCGLLGLIAVFSRRPLHAELSGTVAIAVVCVAGAATARAFDSLDTPGWVFVVAGAAPLGAWLGEAPPFRGRGLASALARLVGVGAIVGLAIWAVAPRLISNGQPDAYALHRAMDPDPDVPSLRR